MEDPIAPKGAAAMSRHTANQLWFIAFGICFGLCFVASALIIELAEQGWRGSPLDLARGSPSLWVVAMAPFVLGTTFYILGKKHLAIGDALQKAEAAAAASAVLAKDNRQYRLLVDEVKDYAIYLLDDAGIVTSWNKGAEMIKGYTPEDIIGQHFSTFYIQEDKLAGLPKIALDTARSEGRFLGEGWRLKKNGDRLWASVVIDPVYDGDEFVGFVKITRDMTRQHDAELALREALRQAECANIAKREFLANMSHELRTPLNGIIGLASVLAVSDLPSSQQAMVEMISRSGDHLKDLIEDIIDMARIDSGQLDLKIEPVRLSNLLEEVDEQFRAPAGAGGLTWSVELSPAADGEFEIPALRLKQILINLVANAVKFTAKGAVNLQVDTVGEGDVLAHRFRIIDTGPGIPESKLEAIFNRFEQVDGSSTRHFEGSGLGLSISRELATLMGGKLEVASTEGQGSTFTLTVPLKRTAGQMCNSTQGSSPPEIEVATEGCLRVLAADDHPINRTVVAAIFAAAGIEVLTVENGEEAVAAAEGEAFTAILMDMQMPVMDGLTATRRIREHERSTGRSRTPIIALTANVLPEHVAAALSAGADDHLGKPVSAPALLEVISRVAGGGVNQSEQALSA